MGSKRERKRNDGERDIRRDRNHDRRGGLLLPWLSLRAQVGRRSTKKGEWTAAALSRQYGVYEAVGRGWCERIGYEAVDFRLPA